jgi:hypothetical protein
MSAFFRLSNALDIASASATQEGTAVDAGLWLMGLVGYHRHGWVDPPLSQYYGAPVVVPVKTQTWLCEYVFIIARASSTDHVLNVHIYKTCSCDFNLFPHMVHHLVPVKVTGKRCSSMPPITTNMIT